MTISMEALYDLQDILAPTLRVVSSGTKSNQLNSQRPPRFQTGRNLYEGMGRYCSPIDPSRYLPANHPTDAAATVDQDESQAGPCRDPTRERTHRVTFC